MGLLGSTGRAGLAGAAAYSDCKRGFAYICLQGMNACAPACLSSKRGAAPGALLSGKPSAPQETGRRNCPGSAPYTGSHTLRFQPRDLPTKDHGFTCAGLSTLCYLTPLDASASLTGPWSADPVAPLSLFPPVLETRLLFQRCSSRREGHGLTGTRGEPG